jgi:hypothetical protein
MKEVDAGALTYEIFFGVAATGKTPLARHTFSKSL